MLDESSFYVYFEILLFYNTCSIYKIIFNNASFSKSPVPVKIMSGLVIYFLKVSDFKNTSGSRESI